MDLEQLEIFIAVVDSGSFTKAAETLYISHSTTSRNVSALEEHLGTRLLIRDSRGIKLTEAGTLLYREGKRLLEQAEELASAVRNAGDEEAGKLSVASAFLFSPPLNDAYTAFCTRYPNIVLGIYHHELSEIFAAVDKGEGDLGVIFSYALPEETQDYEILRIAEERFCVVCAEGHALATNKAVGVEALRSVGYVSVGQQRSEFTRQLEEEILRDRPRKEILSVPTLESLFMQVRSGNGVSLVPYPMAREFGKGCSMVDIADVDTRFDIVVFWRKDRINPSVQLFAELLTERGDCNRGA